MQFVVLVLSRGFGSLLLALCNVLVARWTGPTEFGELSTVLSAGAFYFVIIDFGFSTYISRAQARGDKGEVSAALSLNAWTSIVGGAIAVGAIVLLSFIGGYPLALLLLGLSMALEKNVDTALGVPIADRDKTTPAVSLILRRVVAFAAFVGGYFLGVPPILAYGIAMVIGAVAGQLYTRRKLIAAYRSPKSDRRGVWQRSFPFLISNVTASVRNLDVLIVGATGGTQAAGLYSAAQKLTSPFMLIPGTIATLVLPNAARRSPSGAARIAWKLVAVHLALLVVLIVVAQFSTPLVELLLGSAFAASAPIFAWTLVAFPFVALSSPLGGVLQSQGHERVVASNGIVFAVLLVVAIAAGALLFGGVGAAIALAAVYTLKCLTLVVIIWRRLR